MMQPLTPDEYEAQYHWLLAAYRAACEDRDFWQTRCAELLAAQGSNPTPDQRARMMGPLREALATLDLTPPDDGLTVWRTGLADVYINPDPDMRP